MSGAGRVTAAEIARTWRPPTDAEVDRDLAVFASLLRQHLGDRLKGAFLFGSRARGDHGTESDADVAVIVGETDAANDDLSNDLVDIAYQVLLEGRAVIQPFAVSLDEWVHPDRQHNPSFGRAMVRDAQPLP